MIDPNAPHQDDEILTAYLDGELEEETRKVVQRRLIDDAELRQRLAELQRTWDLLDDLPDTPVNQEFTKSTIELVAQSVEKGWNREASENDKVPVVQRWTRFRRWGLLLVSGLAIGLLSGWLTRQQSQRAELKELEIIAFLPGLRTLETIEVLREVAEIVDLNFAASDSELLADRVLPPIPYSIDKRDEWVLSLSSRQRALLWAHDQDENLLAIEDRKEIEAFARTIRLDPEKDKLQRALTIVGALLESESSEEIALIRNLSADKRAERIRQLFYRRLGEWYARNMTEADNRRVLVLHEAFWRDPAWSEALFTSRGSLREFTIASILDDADPMVLQSLVNDLSEFASRILKNVHPQDQTALIAKWLYGRDRKFDEVVAVYQKWDSATQEKFDLRSFEELKEQVNIQQRQRRRPQDPRR